MFDVRDNENHPEKAAVEKSVPKKRFEADLPSTDGEEPNTLDSFNMSDFVAIDEISGDVSPRSDERSRKKGSGSGEKKSVSK